MIARPLTCLAVAAFAMTAIAQAPANITAEELTRLRLRLARLEAENKALQKELDELRAFRAPADPQPSLRDPLTQPPPNWTPREFQGQRYYVVPLTPPGK